jgi:hypothetical protein
MSDSKQTLVIQALPPRDGGEWDCQCARCGSSCDYVDCWNCEDGGCGSDCIDDLCHGGECIHGHSGQIRCDICDGHGGWWACLSDSEWCNANPIAGREEIKFGQIEWFKVSDG